MLLQFLRTDSGTFWKIFAFITINKKKSDYNYLITPMAFYEVVRDDGNVLFFMYLVRFIAPKGYILNASGEI